MINVTQKKWYGSKITKKIFRNSKKKSIKLNIVKLTNLEYKNLDDGGWHFSFLYDVEGIIKNLTHKDENI